MGVLIMISKPLSPLHVRHGPAVEYGGSNHKYIHHIEAVADFRETNVVKRIILTKSL
jgi:hypothetical protein